MYPTESSKSAGTSQSRYEYDKSMQAKVTAASKAAMEKNKDEFATKNVGYKPNEALSKDNVDKVLDGVQTALDVAGLVPGIGEAADFVNGLISVVRGDYAGAVISFASMIPVAGAAGPVLKQLENLSAGLKDTILKKLLALLESLKKGGLKKTLDGASTAMDEIFEDISKEIPELGEAMKDIKDVIVKKGACFVAGTKVYTPDGLKPIESIHAGDMVFAKNPESGEEGIKRVKKTSVNETYVLYHIYLNSEEICTTAEHPFWVYGKGFLTAAELETGDELVHFSDGGEYAGQKIERAEKSLLTEKVLVYNFIVEDWHTYFVGEGRIWVHNVQNSCGAAGDLTRASDDVADSYADDLTRTNRSGRNFKTPNNEQANRLAREQGYADAHDLKESFVGETNISKFDIKIDKDTGEVFLEGKQNKTLISTGIFKD